MKRLIVFFSAVLFNCLMGGMLATTVGLSPITGAVGLNLLAAAVGSVCPENSLRAGVLKEVWTGEMVKALRAGLEGTWLDGIPDNSSIVDNDVIHLIEVGVDPDVLINNTTYPIPVQALDDKDIAIKLDKFQTKVTPITDDELYASSYDKMARVKESHSHSINDSKFTKAAHSLCAQKHTPKTPVLVTAGEREADTGRLRMTVADIVEMKKSLDKLKVPVANRRLVLCPDHVNDLLLTDEKFAKQYSLDAVNGKIGRLYGFDVYEYVNTPLYTAAGVKKNIGAEVQAGEFNCSFAFYTSRVFKATGSTKMYHSQASTDPEYQQNKINFRHYFICMPKLADAGVVMRSGYKETP